MPFWCAILWATCSRRVDFQIPGYYSSYVILDPITSISSSKQVTTGFQYSTDWGINYFQMKFTCRENIPLAIDTELYTDWYQFFIITPYQPPPTPTTPTTPNDPSSTSDNPNNIGLIIGIIGGVIGLVALTIGTTIYIKGKNKPASRLVVQETTQTSTALTGFCTNCGSQISSNDPYCSICGAKKL